MLLSMVKHFMAFGDHSGMGRFIMAFAPAIKQEFTGTMACKTASRLYSNKQNSYVCSQQSEGNCCIKPMEGQRICLKQHSVLTKFIFTVEKPKRKKPADEELLNTKKTLL